MTAALAESKIVPPGHGALGIDGLALTARVRGILNRHPAVGLAGGVVGSGGLEFFSGHGLADIASNARVSEDTVVRIGSITKTFTAIAVLQLWEQGWSISTFPPTTICAGTDWFPRTPRSGRRRCASC
jgi:CubicO group peptidase (beta-lactamase class C family)